MRNPLPVFQKHSAWIDIAVFTVILSIFFYSALRLTQKKSPTRLGQNKQLENLRSVNRLPASHVIKTEENSIKVLDLGCLPLKNKTYTTKSAYLRFSATLCNKTAWENIRGLNETNGFDITCFLDFKAQRMATSFFQLNPGINHIRLSMHSNSGKNQEELFTVLREI